MQVNIREETAADHQEVAQLIKAAFADDQYGNHTEHLLVEKLRATEAFIPSLSLVAVMGNEIVGHILLTKVKITNRNESVDSLSLAPVSVKPTYQNKGIGAKLIRNAHRRARELGYRSILLLGHRDYYPRFGYELMSKYGIELPFGAPQENCMIIELEEGALEGVNGVVEYPPPFYD